MTADPRTYTGVSPSHGPLAEPAERWRAPVPGTIVAPPTVTTELVLAFSNSGVLLAVDRNGSARWSSTLGGLSDGAPRVEGDVVYVGTSERRVFCLDLPTGEARWTAQVGGWVHRELTVVDGTVLVSGGDGKLLALDAANGLPLWSASIGGKESLSASVGDGEAYAAGGRKVHAIALGSGRKTRSATLEGISAVRTAPVVASDEVLVVGTLDRKSTGSVIALDRRTFAERWRVPMEGQVTGALAVSDGIVIAAGERGAMRGIDLGSGVVRWEHPDCCAGVCRSMVVARGVAYVGERWTGLRAVDAATGAERWRYRLANGGHSPAVADGMLFVGRELGLLALA